MPTLRTQAKRKSIQMDMAFIGKLIALILFLLLVVFGMYYGISTWGRGFWFGMIFTGILSTISKAYDNSVNR